MSTFSTVNMSGELTIIESTDWLRLRDKFLINWPVNAMGYYTIDNFIKWKRIDASYVDCIFYALDGDWDDGTVLILVDASTSRQKSLKTFLL